MCGIFGFIDKTVDAVPLVSTMLNALDHRGPDDRGYWHNSNLGVVLGQTRLSIVDLSPAGHQPMASASGRYVIVFNGEIYNHLEIRANINEHKLIVWKSYTDTETLLEAVELWGLEEALKKITGMFAFAIWDSCKETLSLVRDRLGEKPLYYSTTTNGLVFSSELKGMKNHPSVEFIIDRNVLNLYLKYSSIPHPFSIYHNIWKLEPATVAVFNVEGKKLKSYKFWDAFEVAGKSNYEMEKLGYKAAVNMLEEKLSKAVALQMMADVPLGAFLSGGVDSSVIVALMQIQSRIPIKTFTIGFDVPGYDEAKHALAVAKHLKTEHHELYVTEKDALALIPLLPTIYDEPFGDSSQIPAFFVSQMAKKNVTVALSGDGGDELFGGYNRYTIINALWKRIRFWPLPIRRLVASALVKIPVHSWNSMMPNVAKLKYANIGYKIHRGAQVIGSKNEMEVYHSLISRFQDTDSLLNPSFDYYPLKTELDLKFGLLKTEDNIEQMMLLDLVTYLPWDILTKLDRAAMAVSLETRIPMLDHSVVEFAWSLPMEFKLRNGVGKSILKDVLYKYVPKSMIERPKMGFGIPIALWLRGPLMEWAESLLNEKRLLKEGYLNPRVVQKYWSEHKSGKRDWEHQLWNVLMFQAWLENEHDNRHAKLNRIL
jgi:asparagine synthase (glutamine-hydrolysing)